MMSERCLCGLRAASLILVLVAASASAMVISDGESTEIVLDTDVAVVSIDTSPATTTTQATPPQGSNMELLRKIGWNCGLVHPVPNISLDTIMGRWYLVEIITSSPEMRRDPCAGVDFGRWDVNENNLMPDVMPPPYLSLDYVVMRGFNRHANEHHRSSYRLDAASVVRNSRGAIWDQPVRSVASCTKAKGAIVAVLDFTPDYRFLTVTTCVPHSRHEWTTVLGRDPDSSALPREALHQRLRAAGLRYVDGAKLQDNSDCVYR